MCLESISPKGSIVKKCKKNYEGRFIGWKICKLHTDPIFSSPKYSLVSPFQSVSVFPGDNKCKPKETLKQQNVTEPKDSSKDEFDAYPLGIHIYALKKDAEIVVKELKRIVKGWKLGKEHRKRFHTFIIVPVTFSEDDIITEGIEDYYKDSSPFDHSNDFPFQKQSVVVVQKYHLEEKTYNQAIGI